jgi:NTE family protein
MFWRSYCTPMTKGNSLGGAPPLALALQGGGAYGAFTWGVLDRLLREDDVFPSAISGASAGAVNAVIAAWGLMQGGRDGAREALRRFWTEIGQKALLSPLGGMPGAELHFDIWTRLFSPYQLNPLNIHPLRDILAGMIDFEALRRSGDIALFLSATDVATGEPRVFRETEVSLDVLMASTCLPRMTQAVEIDGRSYWDGGFSANPPILPMVLETGCRSLLVVKLTPDEEPDLPTQAADIVGRLQRILVNGSLQRDLAALEEMRNLLHRSNLSSGDLRRIRDLGVRHVTIDHRFFAGSNGNALNPRPEMLERLFDSGAEAADALICQKSAPAESKVLTADDA